MIELLVTTKKELRFRENELFACLKCAFVSDGGPEEMANRMISDFQDIGQRNDIILNLITISLNAMGQFLPTEGENGTIPWENP